MLKIFALVSTVSAIPTLPNFEEWQTKFGKQYDANELTFRQANFEASKIFVQNHNLKYQNGESTYWTDLNQFSDLSEFEWKARFNENFEQAETSSTSESVTGVYSCQNVWNGNDDSSECIDCQTNADNPDESIYYWQDLNYNNAHKNVVTAIKDQGACGACYAFAATAVLESQLCLQDFYDCNTWTGISEQNCVDCIACNKYDRNEIVGKDCSHGCYGGNSQNCWNYASINQGIDSSDSYPYVSGTTRVEGTCEYAASDNVFVAGQNIDSNNICVKAPQGNEQIMMQAINNFGPIKVSMYSSDAGFRYYSGGIYTADMTSNVYNVDCPEGVVDHAVTLTGYGTYRGLDSVQDYWMLRNSWGTSWGIDGYMKFRRNYSQGNKYGMCSIGKYAYWTYVV